MSTSNKVMVPKRTIDADKLGFFRFGRLGDGVILTNDVGQWQHLDTETFGRFLQGGIEADDALYGELSAKGFLRQSLDLDALADAVRARKRFVGMGPARHCIQLADGAGTLSVEVAKDIIDHAMLSTSRELSFHLIADSAAVDTDLLKFIVQYTTEKNRYEGKTIVYRLVASLKSIDEATAKWLVTKRFEVQTTLAGDEAAHEALLDVSHAAHHADVLATIGALHAAAEAKNRAEWRVQAHVPVGDANVGNPAGVVAALAAAGVRRFRVEPILSGAHAISVSQFATFYRGLVDALLDSEAAGTSMREDFTTTMLQRMLRTEGTSDTAIRSPSAHGTGMLCYDTKGQLYPNDTARRLHAEQEDGMFLLGTAGITSYKESVTHPTVRALSLSSLVESLPGFSEHWSAPFLGVDPVSAYIGSGDLFTRLDTSDLVAAQLAVVTALFDVLIADGDDAEALEDLLS